jgi:hypothetical protein
MVRRPARRNFRQPGNQRQHRSLAHRKLTATQGPERSGPTFSGNAEECVIAGAARYAPGTPPAFSPHKVSLKIVVDFQLNILSN